MKFCGCRNQKYKVEEKINAERIDSKYKILFALV